jgi:hypothetical protein
MSTENHYIAGWNTPNDWIKFTSKLIVGGSENEWDAAFKEYYKPRLDLRYLNPIKILQENGTFQGEGFSIMTILCSLIEFLESTCQGKIYKYCPKGQKPGPNEYSSSKEMFISFLLNRDPFKNTFSKQLAIEFYSSIRCGLLHEASTKNGWRIWASSGDGKIIDEAKKLVFRDTFEKSIRQFIDEYGTELRSNQTLQKAFLFKFDSL